MCGISGFVRSAPCAEGRALVREMCARMAHRGPDDAGTAILDGGRVFLGFRRLSILDLSEAGHQPMLHHSGDLVVVFNGELYNFMEVRAELEGLGAVFHSRSDTEVLLEAWHRWGEACLQRFRGMFGFALWDRRDRSLWLVRDRLGIKPLYYTMAADGTPAFASEIKSLLALPWVQASPDMEGVLGHLLFLWLPEPRTAFAGIHKLEAGHLLHWKDGRSENRPWWQPRITDSPRPQNEGEALEELKSLFDRVIQRHLVSDVPVGAFLSGGLDSSLIVARMAALRREGAGNPLDTYSIIFNERDKAFEAMPDDQRYARIVAAHTGSNHHEIMVEDDAADHLERLIWHLDEPIADPAAINTWLICRQAKQQGTTVMLSGMGADEVFGGYRKHLSAKLAADFRRWVPGLLRKGVIAPLVDALPVAGRTRGYRLFRWAKRFMKSANLPPLDCFMGNYAYYDEAELNGLLQPEHRFRWHETYSVRRHRELLEPVKHRDLVQQMTWLDTRLFLVSHNLNYSDKASMAAGVELRVPFVDHEFTDWALDLPSRHRIRGLRQKHLLKELGLGLLPRAVVERPKAPFGSPLRSWMRHGLRPLLDDVLGDESVRRRGLFDPQALARMRADNDSGKADYGHRLWALLTLELWYRRFIDGSTPFPSDIPDPVGPGRELDLD